jgi:ribonuclease P/MRP protein subunit POP8
MAVPEPPATTIDDRHDTTRVMDQAQKIITSEEVDSAGKQAETRPKKRQKPNGSATHHTATLRSPRWTYFHLRLFTSSTTSTSTTEEPALDALTVKRYITAALSRFLGQMGAATPVDILKLDQQDVWIRVPRDDATVVHEAMSSWVSNQGGMGDGSGLRWIIKGRDDWLVRLVGGEGQDLFTA